jgi:3-mercaptopyruvate sulfurtransferase SseA
MNHAGVMGVIPEVMIKPETLNNWLINGYGVDTFGYNRMVILAVDNKKSYENGHIPGAYLLENNSIDLWSNPVNGITETNYQITTRTQMDKIIHRANIDTDAIVILTGSKMTEIARAYFNFRYWGFPKQQLKVLNGTNTTYTARGFSLQTETPSFSAPCQFSVCNTTGSDSFSAVRASLEEMFTIAADNNPDTIIIDSRSSEEYAGTPGSTLLDSTANKFVVFEGHIRTAVNIDYKSLLAAQGNNVFLASKKDLITILTRHYIDKNKKIFVYGSSPPEDSLLFLVLDAVFNWQVKFFEGGWSQWGQMAGNSPAKGGMLAEDSPWRTDTATLSESIAYNKSSGFLIEKEEIYDSYAKQGDLINSLNLEICGKKGADMRIAPLSPGY